MQESWSRPLAICRARSNENAAGIFRQNHHQQTGFWIDGCVQLANGTVEDSCLSAKAVRRPFNMISAHARRVLVNAHVAPIPKQVNLVTPRTAPRLRITGEATTI